MKQYLLSFTIGPVQSFIGNSRKMRDLYAGSFLLSYLIIHTCNAVDALKTDIEIKRLLPVYKKNETPNVPNRILLRVTFSDEQCLKGENFICGRLDGLAKFMEKEVRSEFKEIYESVFEKCEIKPNKSIIAQLKDFPEVYWAYQECKSVGGKISKDDIEKITSKLQAAKTIRPFSQTTEPAGRKCSLFPEYNAIFVKYKDDKKTQPEFLSEVIEFANEDKWFYALKPGEGLSALAFIKRMLYCIADKKFQKYQYNTNIISVAYMLLKNRFENDSVGENLFKDLSAEAAEAVFDRQNGFDLANREYKEKDKKAAEELLSYLKEEKISSYYAVVKFDGDNIGSTYSNCSEERQRQLSEKIGEFATKVPDIIKEYKGECIYAGGDDFLGFFPVSKAIRALMALREKFQEMVHNQITSEKLTFSAGIVYAHLMPPLKNVLNLADEMERLAKRDKNSYAITVYKRSGKETIVCNPFGESCASLDAIQKIYESVSSGTLSVSSIYSLLSVLQELVDGGQAFQEEMLKPLVVSSICPPEGKEDIITDILNLFELCNHDLQNFTSALKIAVFLGKEEVPCTTK